MYPQLPNSLKPENGKTMLPATNLYQYFNGMILGAIKNVASPCPSTFH